MEARFLVNDPMDVGGQGKEFSLVDDGSTDSMFNFEKIVNDSIDENVKSEIEKSPNNNAELEKNEDDDEEKEGETKDEG